MKNNQKGAVSTTATTLVVTTKSDMIRKLVAKNKFTVGEIMKQVTAAGFKVYRSEVSRLCELV